MKHILFLLISIILGLSVVSSCKNEATTHSKPEWVSIFNGNNLDGWHVKIKDHPLNENYNNTFVVEGGAIAVRVVTVGALRCEAPGVVVPGIGFIVGYNNG